MRLQHICIMLLLISGCTSQQDYTGYTVKDDFENPHVKNLYTALERSVKESRYDEQASNVKLVEVSTAVSKSLRELARIQRSINDVSKYKDDSSIIQAKVGGKTSIDYTGSVEILLRRIAKTTGLGFRTIGNPPPVPTIVSVNKRDVMITDLIRDVAYQVQTQASVTLTNEKVIEVRYL